MLRAGRQEGGSGNLKTTTRDNRWSLAVAELCGSHSPEAAASFLCPRRTQWAKERGLEADAP